MLSEEAAKEDADMSFFLPVYFGRLAALCEQLAPLFPDLTLFQKAQEEKRRVLRKIRHTRRA